MSVGFTYVLVEANSSEFFKVGKGSAKNRGSIISEARKRLGKQQSCNIRQLRFDRLFEFVSSQAASAAEQAWHKVHRRLFGILAYSGQEWYPWSDSLTPAIVEAFMRCQIGFVAVSSAAKVVTSCGRYPGYAVASSKESGLPRQMRVHVLRLAEPERHWWQLYGTAAPHEGSKGRQDYASYWWTGNPFPHRITTEAVIERDKFDPRASQAEVKHAIAMLRHEFAAAIAPAARPTSEKPFVLTWFAGEEGSVFAATLASLGPSWQRHPKPKTWPVPGTP